jgi:hypothetical protein
VEQVLPGGIGTRRKEKEVRKALEDEYTVNIYLIFKISILIYMRLWKSMESWQFFHDKKLNLLCRHSGS